MQDVQAFGTEFASKYLPGYQTIVCTHSDGNNGSGNIHCHIVINAFSEPVVIPNAMFDIIAGMPSSFAKEEDYGE